VPVVKPAGLRLAGKHLPPGFATVRSLLIGSRLEWHMHSSLLCGSTPICMLAQNLTFFLQLLDVFFAISWQGVNHLPQRLNMPQIMRASAGPLCRSRWGPQGGARLAAAAGGGVCNRWASSVLITTC